jgi:uncharacterized membrane protein YqiK
MSTLSIIFTIAICVAAALVILWLLLRRFYHKASREMAFVRTGFGGQKVVMNAGALVIPVLHEIIPVNMNTLRLEVIRANHQALITRDRMRVDVHVEFFVRVKPTPEAVADAAQTLGRRTMDAKALQELVEGRFVDALRAVAAEMNMDELHEKRIEFVRRIQAPVAEDLAKNGLELVSVSLSAMDQTDQSYFNPQNAFDAQGLTILTEVIQARMRRRNEVERDAEVAMRRKNLEAERHKLELTKEEEFARLDQQRAIEVRRAEQQALIVAEQVEKERQAKEAQILAKQRVDQAQIAAEQSVQEERIARDQLLKTKEIASELAVELSQAERERQVKEAQILAKQKVDQVQIAAERGVEDERIARDLYLKEKEIARDLYLKEKEIARNVAIEAAEIEGRKQAQLTELERIIAIAAKTKDQYAAEAETNKTRLSAIQLEEQVNTARQVEIAERQKLVELIDARKKAEREAIGIVANAEARKKAALEQAEAVRIIAKGESDKIKLTAAADAEAEMTRAEGSRKRYAVEAEGSRALHEAQNILDPNVIAMRIKMAVIEHLPEIIRESVKPMESIEGIKIIHVDGLGAPYMVRAGAEGGAVPAAGGSLAEQLVNSALRYRGQAPIVDAILKEIGISGGDLAGFTGPLKTEPSKEEPTPEKE